MRVLFCVYSKYIDYFNMIQPSKLNSSLLVSPLDNSSKLFISSKGLFLFFLLEYITYFECVCADTFQYFVRIKYDIVVVCQIEVNKVFKV